MTIIFCLQNPRVDIKEMRESRGKSQIPISKMMSSGSFLGKRDLKPSIWDISRSTMMQQKKSLVFLGGPRQTSVSHDVHGRGPGCLNFKPGETYSSQSMIDIISVSGFLRDFDVGPGLEKIHGCFVSYQKNLQFFTPKQFKNIATYIAMFFPIPTSNF